MRLQDRLLVGKGLPAVGAKEERGVCPRPVGPSCPRTQCVAQGVLEPKVPANERRFHSEPARLCPTKAVATLQPVSTEAHLSRLVGPQGWVRPGGGGPGHGIEACEASELRGLLSSASPPPPDASSSRTPADRVALRALITGLTHPTVSYSIVS